MEVGGIRDHFILVVYIILLISSARSKLLQLGWTQQQISERVKEKAVTESESIYGTLYGTLGEELEEPPYVLVPAWLSYTFAFVVFKILCGSAS